MTNQPAAVQHQAIRQKELARHLFVDGGLNAYAVLDGASNPALLDHLYDGERPGFACLYRGELEPDMAECAPYLVSLEPDSPFARWVIDTGFGKHWGIIMQSRAGLPELLQHFRKHSMVYDEENQPILFRYYGPRVLCIFWPSPTQNNWPNFSGRLRFSLPRRATGKAICVSTGPQRR
ncbi:MAG: DUF4123 domain-containing protein [Candidatus Methylumidiphilus sp.]